MGTKVSVGNTDQLYVTFHFPHSALRPATGGRPGDLNSARPDRWERRFRSFIATPFVKVLRRPQRNPRAGSQSYPSPAAVADADGSTAIWIAPEQPEGVSRGNWIQSVPGKGWFTLLRLYSPLQAFFDKSWRPSEIELVQ